MFFAFARLRGVRYCVCLSCHFAWQVHHALNLMFRTLRSTPHTSRPRIIHTALYTPDSTLYTSHATRRTQHSTPCTPHFTLRVTLHAPYSTFALYASHSRRSTLQSALWSPHTTLHTPQLLHTVSILYILHVTLHTLEFTLRPTLPTLHSTLQGLQRHGSWGTIYKSGGITYVVKLFLRDARPHALG